MHGRKDQLGLAVRVRPAGAPREDRAPVGKAGERVGDGRPALQPGGQGVHDDGGVGGLQAGGRGVIAPDLELFAVVGAGDGGRVGVGGDAEDLRGGREGWKKKMRDSEKRRSSVSLSLPAARCVVFCGLALASTTRRDKTSLAG